MAARGRNRQRYNNRNPSSLASSAKETAMTLDADSPVLALFRATAIKLNDRHDRHERLVKLSRDITIESKRVIFLLHSAISKDDSEKAIAEANDRLTKLINGPIKAIALELEKSPSYLHARAVSPGLQEFIEAKTLCHLLQHRILITCSQVQKEFEFSIKEKTEEGEAEVEREKRLVTLLPPVDFMLGVADLTGELMRRTINSLSSGDSEECFQSCQVVRDLYTGFLRIFGGGKEIARKMSTIRANVSKVESAVYALHVRGGEAPPSLLLSVAAPHAHADIDTRERESDDEGFF